MAEERQAYTEISPWWGEHKHRYCEALKWLKKDAVVLDLACGNGYGTFLLSQHTSNSVIGGDLDAEAVKECRARFQNKNLSYQVIDATKIPFKDEEIDAVVSFETIEHTVQYKEVCAEFYRVLKKDGVLILSTPNFIINSPKGVVENPYHTQEFTLKELKEVLNEIPFSKIDFFGQQYTRFSNPSFLGRIAKFMETVFYMRGIRKLPLVFKNALTRILIGKTHYPDIEDYALVSSEAEILTCKTFFVVCKK